MPGSWLHLSRRFFGSLVARDLESEEVDALRDWLSEAEFALFSEQRSMDRRHGYESARYAFAAGASSEIVRAAAMHDVAKRHARLGVIGRVLATLLIKLGVPVRGRFDVYRRHGPIGAEELEQARSPHIAIQYARWHHADRPSDVDPNAWSLLTSADEAGERSQSVRFDR